MDQKWIDDLNHRFPGIGYEFQDAVQQKIDEHDGILSVEEIIEKLVTNPAYALNEITSAETFGLHSDLMLLYPAVGKYEESLKEAKILRDFVLKYSPSDPKIIQTFRGVYAELLTVNGQYEQALQESEEAIVVNPDEEGTYLARGAAYIKLGQLDNALNDLKILIQKPGAEKYAQQLFVFLMENRNLFQEAQVQENTMIDIMLKELEPEPGDKTIRIPVTPEAEEDGSTTPPPAAQPTVPSTPQAVGSTEPPSNSKDDDLPLENLVTLDATKMTQVLGAPLMESDGELTFDRDYTYRGHTLTVGFDKSTRKVVSLQMFFLPPIDEATALERMGLRQQNIPPSISSDMLKVWIPYATFSKVRLSLTEGQVMAIIIEP